MGYTHQIPGRLRVRSFIVKHNAQAAQRLQRWVESIPGVSRVQINVLTGSVLMHYDVRVADGKALLSLLHEESWIIPAETPVRSLASRMRPLLRRKSSLH